MPMQLGVLAEVYDVLDEALAFIISGMCLTRKNELDRALLILRQPHHALELLEHQGARL